MDSKDTFLLTIAEAASLLRVCERTILRRVTDGTISSIRIGGIIRIPREQFRMSMVVPTTAKQTL
jgi:excisionase family DNA binding protein